LKNVGRIAGLKHIRFIKELIAALMAYGSSLYVDGECNVLSIVVHSIRGHNHGNCSFEYKSVL